MCPADHFFDHNFYDFLIFLKRMLGFQEKCILFRFATKNGSYAFFLSRTVRFFVCTGSKTFC